MKRLALASALIAYMSFSYADLGDYALPIVGTDNTKELSTGNLYPCIARPWGAHAWTPQTGDNETGWIYAYGEKKIRGIRLTHQPSPWIGDYGQFSLLPTKGLVKFDHESRASWFSHKTEFARPHLYRVYLADHDTTVEVTPTCNAAALRATDPATDMPQFVIDAFPGGEITKAEGNVIEGVSRKAKVRWNEKKREKHLENFFRIEFDRPTPDGYCGDEDNGQTSAWYVWSALGFYPVCPGTQEYALGAPQVTNVRLSFGDRTLDIKAVGVDGRPVTDFTATPYSLSK